MRGSVQAVSTKQQRRPRRTDGISITQAPTCPTGTIQWPKNSGFCWIKRETNNVKQGPGDNVFAASNVVLDSSTDKLTLKMVKKGRQTSCAEVILDRSLGHGDYVWQIDTDPSQVSTCGTCIPCSKVEADLQQQFQLIGWPVIFCI